MSKQLVIIPVFNEAPTMPAVVKEVCKYHKQQILIIDDGSTDGSSSTIENLNCPQVKLLRHDTNQGYGATLIHGFEFAQTNNYDYAVTLDADWQHEPQYIPDFFTQIMDYEIVSGSRYLENSILDSEAPPDRARINEQITQKINSITGYSLTDAFCGFKAYNLSALAKLELKEPGYAFPLQLWIQAYKRKLTVKEIAVPKIYLNYCRSFGDDLDDPHKRLKYYEQVIKQEIQKCRLMS